MLRLRLDVSPTTIRARTELHMTTIDVHHGHGGASAAARGASSSGKPARVHRPRADRPARARRLLQQRRRRRDGPSRSPIRWRRSRRTLAGQGQERHLSVHVRRAEPRRHVRLQAQALRARRQDDPGQDLRPRRQEERGPRRRAEVEVQAVRPVAASGSATCSRTWPPASTTSPSSIR